MKPTAWTIAGSDDQLIYGATHAPDDEAVGVVIIAHGFKGYKDYGMFPWLAEQFAAAGFIAHRFNFSHSGMTNKVETFERPDLFQQDTWNKQVADLEHVVRAIDAGELAGGKLPYILFGHSRGGVSAILFAGRHATDSAMRQPVGLITAAAPDTCNSLGDDNTQLLLEQGYLESPSSRTGQALRVGKGFIEEQQADSEGHDVLSLIAKLPCPILIVHGAEDTTAPVEAARKLAAAAADAQLLIIEGGNHVFNTPNPMLEQDEPSEQLKMLGSASITFARSVIAADRI